ncbi:hypothetical protein PVW48_12955 [Dinoroseobacter sp. PD6]|uniref:hypothetical protein n=1 Tax=Dinoroseobacter sp. PD6 TaxID=3028384 RepID=UPI00237A169F|nr:hypothetical protein [Dinoroseobacter sp. PD6]MDD9717661.1 hypothetical protein [Dinoroseobacter sp. PD6]
MDGTTAVAIYGEMRLPVFSLGTTVLLLALTLPAAAVTGFLFGQRQRARTLAKGKIIDKVLGETTLGAILGLLGLLLAFSFGHALSLAQTRKVAVIDEAAALGTVFLRADYAGEGARTDLKTAIYDYTLTRVVPDVARVESEADVRAFLETSLAAQAKLWPATLAATDGVEPPVATFIASAMNDAIDAHLYRMQTFAVPVSDVTQLMLLATALASLFLLGNRAGMQGRVLSWRTFMFSGFLFVVMVTIVDVQRSSAGFVQTDQSPLLVTIFDMEQALGL